MALASNLPLSISGSVNDAGLYSAPTDIVPNVGELFGTESPSYNLVLYGLVITTPTGATTPPGNGTGGNHKGGLSSIGLILIIIVIVLLVIVVVVIIVWFLCKKMKDSGDDPYEFEVNDLHDHPTLTPNSMPQPSNGKPPPSPPPSSNPRDSVIDCTT